MLIKETKTPEGTYHYKVTYSFVQTIWPSPPLTRTAIAYYSGSSPKQTRKVLARFRQDYKVYKPTNILIDYLGSL